MALEKTQRRAADIFICSMMSVRKVKTLKKPQFELGELMELWGKAAVIETWLTRCSHRGRVQGNHVVGGRNSMSKGLEVGIRLADLRNRKKLVFLGSPE